MWQSVSEPWAPDSLSSALPTSFLSTIRCRQDEWGPPFFKSPNHFYLECSLSFLVQVCRLICENTGGVLTDLHEGARGVEQVAGRRNACTVRFVYLGSSVRWLMSALLCENMPWLAPLQGSFSVPPGTLHASRASPYSWPQAYLGKGKEPEPNPRPWSLASSHHAALQSWAGWKESCFVNKLFHFISFHSLTNISWSPAVMSRSHYKASLATEG